jgi:hypothetical protein
MLIELLVPLGVVLFAAVHPPGVVEVVQQAPLVTSASISARVTEAEKITITITNMGPEPLEAWEFVSSYPTRARQFKTIHLIVETFGSRASEAAEMRPIAPGERREVQYPALEAVPGEAAARLVMTIGTSGIIEGDAEAAGSVVRKRLASGREAAYWIQVLSQVRNMAPVAGREELARRLAGRDGSFGSSQDEQAQRVESGAMREVLKQLVSAPDDKFPGVATALIGNLTKRQELVAKFRGGR